MKLLAMFNTPKAPATAPGAIVLYERNPSYLHPFVTWWENHENTTVSLEGCRSAGHYFRTRKEAEADFLTRCKRGH